MPKRDNKKDINLDRKKAMRLKTKFDKKNAKQTPETLPGAEEIIKQARVKHQHKLFVMWSGVTFFMLLIISAWIFNIQGMFFSTVKRSAVEDEFQFEEVKDLAADLSEQYGELKKIFEEASQSTTSLAELVDTEEDAIEENFNSLPNFEEAKDDAVEVKGISREDIELLKEKLIELADNK